MLLLLRWRRKKKGKLSAVAVDWFDCPDDLVFRCVEIAAN